MSGRMSRPASRSICSVSSVVSTVVFGPTSSPDAAMSAATTLASARAARASLERRLLRQPVTSLSASAWTGGPNAASRTRPWRQGSSPSRRRRRSRRRREAGQRDHADRGGRQPPWSRRRRGGATYGQGGAGASEACGEEVLRVRCTGAARRRGPRVGHEPPSLRAVSGRLHSVAWAGRVNGRKKKARSRGYWRVSGARSGRRLGEVSVRELRRLLNVRRQE